MKKKMGAFVRVKITALERTWTIWQSWRRSPEDPPSGAFARRPALKAPGAAVRIDRREKAGNKTGGCHSLFYFSFFINITKTGRNFFVL